VLGLSVTSAAVRLVVVEGAAGEGDTVRHDAVDIDTLRSCAEDGARGLAEILLGKPLVEAALAGQFRSIGVSWTDSSSAEGSMVLRALAVAGFDDFIAVSECDAATALARALQDLAGSEDIAVCIVEPEAAVVATVHSGKALAERIARTDGGIDELVGGLAPLLHPPDWTPEAIFALGSADDLDLVVASLRDEIPSSIVSAAGADVAMARGAALAAAWAISGAEAQVAVAEHVLTADGEPRERDRRVPKLTTRVGALTSVLVAAVLTFVVSVSAAVGLRLTSDAAPSTAEQRAAAAAPATPANALPPATPPSPQALVPPTAPRAELPPPAPESVAAEAAPLPEAAPPSEAALVEPAEAAPAPVYGPMEPAPPAVAPVEVPPAYVPPPYVAPEPAYVPPAPPAPQPRLRDRIIEKIPIINRFHEPQYPQ
jgi:hypothetical protein